jgi:hypothetical protein
MLIMCFSALVNMPLMVMLIVMNVSGLVIVTLMILLVTMGVLVAGVAPGHQAVCGDFLAESDVVRKIIELLIHARLQGKAVGEDNVRLLKRSNVLGGRLVAVRVTAWPHQGGHLRVRGDVVQRVRDVAGGCVNV